VVDDGTGLLDVAVASVVGAATLAKPPSENRPQNITRTWCTPHELVPLAVKIMSLDAKYDKERRRVSRWISPKPLDEN
jgi:hypothetical protein